ncbi:MAG: DNA topoisomerase VI subunit B [Thermofilum sp.]
MERFRGLSPAEFFHRNREVAGFANPARALYQTIRELVENSLDATENHGILPVIYVEVQQDPENENRVTVIVADNGIGIPLHEVPNVFGRVFYGSKYVIRHSRGVFGLGVKMAVLYAQMTTGKPIYVRTAPLKSPVEGEYYLQIDISRNIPHVLRARFRRKDRDWHGTVVKLTLEGSWLLAKKRILEYIKRTALITPYASIRLKTPEEDIKFKRVTRKLPEPPSTGLYHPRGVDIEVLKEMLRSLNSNDITLHEFLVKNFEGVGEKIALDFLSWAGFDPGKKVKDLKSEDLEQLATKMKAYEGWRRPRPYTLSPLGSQLLEEGVKRILSPEFVAAVSRPPSSYGGHPFIVEAAIAYGGEIPPGDSPLLLRFANRMPLLYDEGVDVSRKVVDSIDWSIYKVKFPAPLAVVIHICSTKIPFKGVGKEAIADVPEIERELEIAVREISRELRLYLSRLERLQEARRKEVIFRKYMKEVAGALSYITSIREEELLLKLEELVRGELGKVSFVEEGNGSGSE